MTDVIGDKDARRWAQQWADEWNRHDVDAVLEHFAADVEFTSPVAAAVTGDPVVRGRDALRAYWTAALARTRDLHFDVDDVHVGGGCLAILYRNQTGRRVTEVMVFGTDGKVTRGYALYAPA
ncbi:MAG TPA: nuclear transport factor 2 family protein [Acidimicrobiia bacterium]|nr:nuclear transport factor 2 family protein [Acidimicrobiia bacterium]